MGVCMVHAAHSHSSQCSCAQAPACLKSAATPHYPIAYSAGPEEPPMAQERRGGANFGHPLHRPFLMRPDIFWPTVGAMDTIDSFPRYTMLPK